MKCYICDYSNKGDAFCSYLAEKLSADFKVRGYGYGDTLLLHPIVHLMETPIIFLWNTASFLSKTISLRRDKPCEILDNYYFVNWYTGVWPLTLEHRLEVAKKDFNGSMLNKAGQFDEDFFKEHFYFIDVLNSDDSELQRLVAALRKNFSM